MDITKKVVKRKKLQLVASNYAILIPKKWANEMDWSRETNLILEFLPHRKMIIMSEDKSLPVQAKENEEVSDIIKV